MRRLAPVFVGLAALVWLGGCAGAPGTNGPDASGSFCPSCGDAGTADGGATDGGSADAGSSDAGLREAPVAITRGGTFFGFTERFNRYYTDPLWQPSVTIRVAPGGVGDGGAGDPASPESALARAGPGVRVLFEVGDYQGCFELDSDRDGTYDQPVLLQGERRADGGIGARIQCCATGRKTCINLENADYVAVEGFELVGGDYGIRAVGEGFAAPEHQVGVAMLRTVGHEQFKDPFFTGHSDWLVVEGVKGFDAGSGDGHGIYLSNGSDFNVVRKNELWNNRSSDFQINADPAFSCMADGIAYDSPECDAVAGSHPTGGRGVSDFMLVEKNFFHHGLAQGANFTSVRNSVVRDNVFAFYARHGVSFWQETPNPRLGSRDNLVLHNLFLTTQSFRAAVAFTNDSVGNVVKQNLMIAVRPDGGANPQGTMLEGDATTVFGVTLERNFFAGGHFEGLDAGATDVVSASFDPAWFVAFPAASEHDPAALSPSASAPWLSSALLLPEAPTDLLGVPRGVATDPGPLERP